MLQGAAEEEGEGGGAIDDGDAEERRRARNQKRRERKNAAKVKARERMHGGEQDGGEDGQEVEAAVVRVRVLGGEGGEQGLILVLMRCRMMVRVLWWVRPWSRPRLRRRCRRRERRRRKRKRVARGWTFPVWRRLRRVASAISKRRCAVCPSLGALPPHLTRTPLRLN